MNETMAWNDMVLLSMMYVVWCGMPFAQDVRGLWLGLTRAARLQDKAPDATLRRRVSCLAWHVRWYCPLAGSVMAAVKGEPGPWRLYGSALALGAMAAVGPALAGWEVWQVGGVGSAMYLLTLLSGETWLMMDAKGLASETGAALWKASEMQVHGDRAWDYTPYARYFKQ